MNDFDIVSMLPMLLGTLVLLIVLLIILSKVLVNVGAREIAIKERRYFGAKMPPGRVVATEGEVGIQADVLKPGLHLIRYPFERVERKVPLIEIGRMSLGLSKRLTVNRCHQAKSSLLTALRMRTTTFKIRSRLSSKAA